MPLGQLHAGQLRFHDFTLLREAREQRRSHNQISIPPFHFHLSNPIGHTNKQQPRLSAGTSRFFTTTFGDLTLSLKTLPTLPHPALITQRTFITNLRQDIHLKSLERLANLQPQDTNAQHEFLSNLSRSYPEAVVERFEHYKNFAVDERIALIYLNALARTGNQSKFVMKRFVERLQSSAGGGVSVETIVALQGLTQDKLGRGELANKALQVLAGANKELASGGAFAMSRGVSPNSPLFVQTHNPVKTRDMMFALARHVLIAFLVVSALTVVVNEQGVGGRGGLGALGNGKHIQEAEGSNVRFDDVKGVAEAKAELEEIVLYLKDPAKFTRLGGKLPRGLLLTGPPGTGKTLLAKAIAGEAGVPFFFASGSQFEEVYVGVGAKRIRELFQAAKKKSPSIIFIDELDAVGGTRNLRDQSSLKMTLNELLVQMDGFEENNGIIVIGATNFAESLDSALLRPGRFDKHVSVPLPDVGGRKEILDMYAAKTKIASDVDITILARGTTGFSGADLYNLMNQAAVKASVDGLDSITMPVFEWAKDKILMGAEMKSAVITPESARTTAYHEAGHALVAVLTEGAMPIHKATIMPRGNSLGMVSLLPDGDQKSMSLKEYLASLDVTVGGRVAEELIFGEENVTSGASSDIRNASSNARRMVMQLGFSDDVGLVYYGGDSKPSAKIGSLIDEEVKRMISASYERAKALLKKHSKEHILLAETLLEYETLTGDEVRDLVLNGKKPNRPAVNTVGGARGDHKLFSKSKKKENEKSVLAGLADKIRSPKRDSQ